MMDIWVLLLNNYTASAADIDRMTRMTVSWLVLYRPPCCLELPSLASGNQWWAWLTQRKATESYGEGSHSHSQQADANGRFTGEYTIQLADIRSRTVSHRHLSVPRRLFWDLLLLLPLPLVLLNVLVVFPFIAWVMFQLASPICAY
ncbi:cuticle protein 10.9-like [Tropilaelaps mercedesae]|uniref:Cuticle protein 10.9-like n=1 Tax=Tropilaelaps mercedesae TaxID=418985 RepID=A0A1V9XJN2_9ACAR|nr:cuticle protein 10.9-like [Tropilaelaps mercedesae]